MSLSKKLSLLCLSYFLVSVVTAQNLGWMIGTWMGAENIQMSSSSKLTRTIAINAVSGETFTGIKTNEVNDRGHAKIVTSISGYFNKDQFYFKNGVVLLKKESASRQWWDCSSCVPQNKIVLRQDSIVLISRISGCNQYCDGISVYYRLLCEYDTATQRYLVNLFGNSSDIAAFTPCIKEETKLIASDPDNIIPNSDSLKITTKISKQQQQKIQDSLRNIIFVAKKRQQEVDDSVKNATLVAKKKAQEITDSLKVLSVIEKKRQQQTNDSLSFVKKQEQQKLQDSLRTAEALEKKHKQAIEDSITKAALLVIKRQQASDDSLRLEAMLAKKRQQQLDDSLSLVRKQEQQKLQDSLKTAAILEKRHKQAIEDSLRNEALFAKRRAQAVADSLNVAFLAAKKRQQLLDDSLKAEKVKAQQKVQDSIRNAAAVDKKRRQEIADSTKNATVLAKQKQQAIDDSLRLVAIADKKQRQQLVEDSLKLAAVPTKISTANDTVKASTTKALQQRDNVLLETYHVTTPDILIELFDNAQVDGDKVSVYHNSDLIVNNQMLQKEPIAFKIHADTASRMHEFTMIAENLGTIPPNTALMRITVGKDVYKLSVKTDLKTNAKIVFYYDGN